MPARGLSYFAVLLCFSSLVLSSGCHNEVKPAEKFAFKDASSMRSALRGHWILQEYADSIDAGITPKLLEFTLAKAHSINYDPDGKTPDEVRIGEKKDINQEIMSVDFNFQDARMSFYTKGSQDKVAAKFIVNDGDTILRYDVDSTLGKPMDFFKYDGSMCQSLDAYAHLVNSKFITGKYYNVADTAHAHHIIFTKCGNIEGAGNISSTLASASRYTVQLEGFSTYPDAISFSDSAFIRSSSWTWAVSRDSLILAPGGAAGRSRQVVLLKSR